MSESPLQMNPVGSATLNSRDAMIVETILKSHASVQQHLDAIARELRATQLERARIEQSAQGLGRLLVLSGEYQIEGADAGATFVFVKQPDGSIRMSIQPGVGVPEKAGKT